MGDSLEENAESISLTEIFEKNFPYYISIGMSYEEYWNKDATLVKAYREAWKIKSQIKEWEIWKQGMYVYDALCKVSPILHAFARKGTKPLQYPEKPYGIEEYEVNKTRIEKEKEVENERLKAQLHFRQMFNILNNRFSKGGDK